MLLSTEAVEDTDGPAEHCLRVLAHALEIRDGGTWLHSDRVAAIAMELGRACDLNGVQLDQLRLAALLHDVGKIGVPDRVLYDPVRPEGGDWIIMQSHSVLGEGILLASGAERLAEIAPAVRHHHENYDGSGYPDGLSGEQIPALARLVHLADAYEALSTRRSYHPARGHNAIMEILDAESGSRGDPWMLARLDGALTGSGLRAPDEVD